MEGRGWYWAVEVKYYCIISSIEKMGQWDSSIAYPIDKMLRLCGQFSDHKLSNKLKLNSPTAM